MNPVNARRSCRGGYVSVVLREDGLQVGELEPPQHVVARQAKRLACIHGKDALLGCGWRERVGSERAVGIAKRHAALKVVAELPMLPGQR